MPAGCVAGMKLFDRRENDELTPRSHGREVNKAIKKEQRWNQKEDSAVSF
jgi:hypothetical protein